MKLTAEQSKYIIDYLINEGLEYKEFIDEMHDHLIDSIEAKMSDGLNFAQALGETGGAFDDEIYRTCKLDFLPACGLRALEKKYLKAYSKGTKQEFYQLLKSDPFSIVNVLIMCVIVILGVAIHRSGISALWLVFASIVSYLSVFFYLFYKSVGKVVLSHAIINFISNKRDRVRTVDVDAVLKIFQSISHLIFLMPYFIFLASSFAIYFPIINEVLTPTVNAYLSLGLLAVLLIYSAAMLQFIHRKKLVEK
jgi:hypothetical protein